MWPCATTASGAPEHERAELHRIDAQVEQRTAALFEVEVPVGRDHRAAPAEVRFHQERLANPSLAEDVSQRVVRRQEARPHRLHDEATRVGGSSDDLVGLHGVERERLLAEHVLARSQEEHRIGGVTGGGRRDVDGVDVGITARAS